MPKAAASKSKVHLHLFSPRELHPNQSPKLPPRPRSLSPRLPPSPKLLLSPRLPPPNLKHHLQNPKLPRNPPQRSQHPRKNQLANLRRLPRRPHPREESEVIDRSDFIHSNYHTLIMNQYNQHWLFLLYSVILRKRSLETSDKLSKTRYVTRFQIISKHPLKLFFTFFKKS